MHTPRLSCYHKPNRARACPRELDAVLRALDAGRADPTCEMAVRAAMARALREKKGGSGLYAACRLLGGPPFFLYG